ncbi:hypothetical protein Tco_0536110 [Tanacetum coccineum]
MESWKSLLPLMEESRLSMKHPLEDIPSFKIMMVHFSPQWKFLIHTILHCLSPKKTAWEQFSSNVATAIICLATNITFNFSNLIFKAMVKNLDSKKKFLMYPRFIQILLNKHQRLLLPHKRTYPTPTLTQKLFSNMKRAFKGYSGVNTPLFQTMLIQDKGEGPTIPVVSHHIPTSGLSTSQPPSIPPSIQTMPVAEEAAPMPHDSPLPRVHSLGSDEGSLSLNELTVLCTSLSKKVESLESELKQTKYTYSTALTKLIKRVKKLEQTIKTSQARRRAKVMIFDAEEDEEDSSKLGRSLIEELDMDAGISLVPPHMQLNKEGMLKIVAADKDFVQQLQAGEKVSDEDLPRKLVELVNQRKKFFAQQRAEAKRNKPMTPAQQKEYMSTYIKNKKGCYTLKQLKALSFEEVKEIFEATIRKNLLKDKGLEKLLGQFKSKQMKKAEELSQEQLHQIMMVIPIEEVYVEALQVKYPIIDWEIYFEDSRKHWKIIRVGGHTEAYQTFDDMFKKFNIDDLDKLWNLVKERFRTT